jgi:ADP-ribosylglycohydrolase
MIELAARFRGCLLGGAVGDALGEGIEFLSLGALRNRYGFAGLQDWEGVGRITDDTQMTLFTAEGLLTAAAQGQSAEAELRQHVYAAYRRWLHTQDNRTPRTSAPGWLETVPDLYARRAPGTTCLTALRSGEVGTESGPLNDSKGCGGVMRAAPAGLLYSGAAAFAVGRMVAAITHGHPLGYHAAGALAVMIASLRQGASLADAVQAALEELRREPRAGGCVQAIELACQLAAQSDLTPSAEVVERLGGGWVAEEALAIAVYCSLVFPTNLAAALRLAVNHSGDSDSTGAITGNLLGTALGEAAIPANWLATLELRPEIIRLADDLAACAAGETGWEARYR